jgi:hypothetical protein
MKYFRRIVAFLLVMAMSFSYVSFETDDVYAASKSCKYFKIAKDNYTTTVGKTIAVKATTVKGIKAKDVKVSYNQKFVNIKSAILKGTSLKVKIKALKAGTTTLRIKVKDKSLSFKVKIKAGAATSTTTTSKATTEKAKATTEKAKATTEKAKATVETSTEATVSMSIVERNQKTITKKVVPALSKTSAFKWSTSKKTIAKVTNKGLVTGVKKGFAVITGSLKTGKTVKVKVNVKASKKLKLVSEDVTIPMNYKWKITSSEKDVTFTYESSDTSIATVNKNGEIKSKKKRGNTTITVTASNGKKGTCIVRVY